MSSSVSSAFVYFPLLMSQSLFIILLVRRALQTFALLLSPYNFIPSLLLSLLVALKSR